MKPTCESWEQALSALVDGELSPPEQLTAIDHLLDCPSCRSFYRKARSLAEHIAGVEFEASSEAPPEEIWRRIALESGLVSVTRQRWRSALGRPARLAAAAVLVLGVGMAWVMRSGTPGDLVGKVDLVEAIVDTVDPVDTTAPVVELEEDRGSMTDERFMELAAEILASDRRYHQKMLEVMTVVSSMTTEPEGSTESRSVRLSEGSERISPGEDDTRVRLQGIQL